MVLHSDHACQIVGFRNSTKFQHQKGEVGETSGALKMILAARLTVRLIMTLQCF